jgi:hypothetical protein
LDPLEEKTDLLTVIYQDLAQTALEAKPQVQMIEAEAESADLQIQAAEPALEAACWHSRPRPRQLLPTYNRHPTQRNCSYNCLDDERNQE